MKNGIALTFAAAALCTAAANAQTAPPGYNASDAAQQAKLRADVGSWQCLSSPANSAPSSFTETEQGNWFVTREGGASPATTYERWSHSLQAYVLITVFDSGASNVAQTTSRDPDNATWTQMWPPRDDQGRKRFDNAVSRKGNVVVAVTPFYDQNGSIRTSSITCTKQ